MVSGSQLVDARDDGDEEQQQVRAGSLRGTSCFDRLVAMLGFVDDDIDFIIDACLIEEWYRYDG